jgi:hypothetical protein
MITLTQYRNGKRVTMDPKTIVEVVEIEDDHTVVKTTSFGGTHAVTESYVEVMALINEG